MQVDLAILVIKDRRLTLPEDDKSSYDILADDGFITRDLAERLRQAKGMRNIIAHMYGTVDDELVYHSITEELVGDTRDLIKAVDGNVRDPG